MPRKKNTLPLRPEPPTVDQMVEDIESCQSHDVVFCSINSDNNHDTSDLMSKSFVSSDDPSYPEKKGDLPTDADDAFKNSMNLIQLSEELEEAPSILKEKYEHLEKLKLELQQSIENLKHQSQTALDKSSSSTT